jgi:hypothetical protein
MDWENGKELVNGALEEFELYCSGNSGLIDVLYAVYKVITEGKDEDVSSYYRCMGSVRIVLRELGYEIPFRTDYYKKPRRD